MTELYYCATTGDTWGSWNTVITTAYTTTGAADTWLVWNNNHVYSSGTTITVTTDVWPAWNQNTITAGGAFTGNTARVVVGPPVETEADRAERAERMRVYAENKRLADERAAKLLHETLSETQRAEMEKDRYFTVHAKESKRVYRVRTDKGRHGNIEELDDKGRVVATLCCAPRGSIPDADALLGQKLALEGDEEAFRKAANRTARRVA